MLRTSSKPIPIQKVDYSSLENPKANEIRPRLKKQIAFIAQVENAPTDRTANVRDDIQITQVIDIYTSWAGEVADYDRKNNQKELADDIRDCFTNLQIQFEAIENHSAAARIKHYFFGESL